MSNSDTNGSGIGGGHDDFIWNLAWKAWLNIGTQATTPPKDDRVTYIPSQPFLTALVLIFPGLFNHIKSRWAIYCSSSTLDSISCRRNFSFTLHTFLFYLNLFPMDFDVILVPRFGSDDLQKLCTVLQSSVSVPVHGEASPFILPSLNDPVLTPLQEGVLLCIDTLQRVRNKVIAANFREAIKKKREERRLLNFSNY